MGYQWIMPGGFLVFAPYKRLSEKQTTLGKSAQHGLGDDIFFALLPYTDQQWANNEDEQEDVVRGIHIIPSLWDIKLKPPEFYKRVRNALGFQQEGQTKTELRFAYKSTLRQKTTVLVH